MLMTSNFAEKLDRALVRPGRIDKMIFLGNISPRSAEMMFLRMYAPDSESNATSTVEKKSSTDPDALRKLALNFSTSIPHDTCTPAQLQGFLLSYRNNPAKAVADIAGWARDEKATLDEAEQRAKKTAERRKIRRRDKRLLKAMAQTMSNSGRDEQADKMKSALVMAMKVKEAGREAGNDADAESEKGGDAGKGKENDGMSSPEELVMVSEGEKEATKA